MVPTVQTGRVGESSPIKRSLNPRCTGPTARSVIWCRRAFICANRQINYDAAGPTVRTGSPRASRAGNAEEFSCKTHGSKNRTGRGSGSRVNGSDRGRTGYIKMIAFD